MKLMMIMARLHPRRPGPRLARQARPVEIGRDWSVRDWADLPVHHPRDN
ncbi:MAG: hypothetical protein HY834_11565 [Devosia nanyangense]|uniref:Uncharacterized protein n=1 Tax=Devosia nanyangense TaxID=1228055 RepID=A0A933L182_9HYPH|nr:hypothetical protein [Devosia nanyangense]